MCRPNYSLWLAKANGSHGRFALQLRGEGSHKKILDGFQSIDDLILVDLNGRNILISPKKLIPMECIWSENPKIFFQPNINAWLDADSSPLLDEYEFAQAILDREIGTIDRLFNWLEKSIIIARQEDAISEWLYEGSIFPRRRSVGAELGKLAGRSFLADREKYLQGVTFEDVLEFYYRKIRRRPERLPLSWRERV